MKYILSKYYVFERELLLSKIFTSGMAHLMGKSILTLKKKSLLLNAENTQKCSTAVIL